MVDLKSAAAIMGSAGGRSASDNMTPEERTNRARKAANARWAKAKPNPNKLGKPSKQK